MAKKIVNFPEIIGHKELDLSPYNLREKIELLEWVMLNTMEDIKENFVKKEFIFKGLYYRSVEMPKGVCVTGYVHLKDHLCILFYGDLSIMTDSGPVRITAPPAHVFTIKAGTKKALYSHEDSLFATVHRTEALTIEEARAEFYALSDLSWCDELMKDKIMKNKTEKKVLS